MHPTPIPSPSLSRVLYRLLRRHAKYHAQSSQINTPISTQIPIQLPLASATSPSWGFSKSYTASENASVQQATKQSLLPKPLLTQLGDPAITSNKNFDQTSQSIPANALASAITAAFRSNRMLTDPSQIFSLQQSGLDFLNTLATLTHQSDRGAVTTCAETGVRVIATSEFFRVYLNAMPIEEWLSDEEDEEDDDEDGEEEYDEEDTEYDQDDSDSPTLTVQDLVDANNELLTEIGEGGAHLLAASPLLDLNTLAASSKYVFMYRIRIENLSNDHVQVLGRNWEIRDSRGEVTDTVREPTTGVVGCYPVLPPGGAFEYSSGTNVASMIGSMDGSLVVVRVPEGTESATCDGGGDIAGFDAKKEDVFEVLVGPMQLVGDDEDGDIID